MTPFFLFLALTGLAFAIEPNVESDTTDDENGASTNEFQSSDTIEPEDDMVDESDVPDSSTDEVAVTDPTEIEPEDNVIDAPDVEIVDEPDGLTQTVEDLVIEDINAHELFGGDGNDTLTRDLGAYLIDAYVQMYAGEGNDTLNIISNGGPDEGLFSSAQAFGGEGNDLFNITLEMNDDFQVFWEDNFSPSNGGDLDLASTIIKQPSGATVGDFDPREDALVINIENDALNTPRTLTFASLEFLETQNRYVLELGFEQAGELPELHTNIYINTIDDMPITLNDINIVGAISTSLELDETATLLSQPTDPVDSQPVVIDPDFSSIQGLGTITGRATDANTTPAVVQVTDPDTAASITTFGSGEDTIRITANLSDTGEDQGIASVSSFDGFSDYVEFGVVTPGTGGIFDIADVRIEIVDPGPGAFLLNVIVPSADGATTLQSSVFVNGVSASDYGGVVSNLNAGVLLNGETVDRSQIVFV